MAAVEAAIAASLRVNASQFELSAPSLYYCSSGGKTCKSGWELEKAMELVGT
jgi:hypothetical protein